MTLPGGAANKIGNRYERWWTVSELLRILDGDTDALRIEDPGVEKAEFVVEAGSRREFHQAKRSHPKGKWTMQRLWSEGILRAAGEQLADNENLFVFVSSSDAPELRSLCEAARDAYSDDEFRQHFLKADKHRAEFETLLERWQCNGSQARNRLCRMQVRVIDERELIEKVDWKVKALFLGPPIPIVDTLRAITEDSVHHRWTRGALVQKVESRGFYPRTLRRPENAAVAVEGATDRYLAPVRRRLIRDELVPNAAVGRLFSNLDGAARDWVITGSAGSGKSAFVVELVDRLREGGFPVLALRLDRVPSTATTPQELGRSLELEESPAFVLLAAAQAAGRPAALVVDQLDAVSTMSGRSSGAFDLVESLIGEVRVRRARAALHTVVVCRTFDWENDSRLRRFVPPDSDTQIQITKFALEDVKRILASSGFNATLLSSHQIELLRLPQNLSLFLEAGFPASATPAFENEMALFDRYWAEKRRSVTERLPSTPDEWQKLMSTLCSEMTAAQQLSVPRETLDHVSQRYLEAVASDGVLILDERSCGFAHESFFDYCFARDFVRERRKLISFLLELEQHLFRRAQVRQVLAYLRGRRDPRYAHELTALLAEDGVRLHLKELAFALLSQVGDPREDEWTIWEPWLRPALKALEDARANPSPVSQLAWRKFFGSGSWFDFVDERGLIARWLASGSDGLADMAVTYLAVHHRTAPDRTATLLEPHADGGGKWPARLRAFMQRAQFQASGRLFELFLHLIDNGVLDDEHQSINENRTFWSVLYTPSRARLESVPEILAHRLRRRLSLLQAAGEEPGRRELLGYDRHLADPMMKAGKKAPSVLSHQNIRINGFQFAARIVDVHLPIHAPLTPVDIGGPSGDFAAKSLEIAETATVEALTGHGAQLAFRDVQPASVLGGVTEHDAANQRPRPLRLKPFVESAFGVRVEVVADHNDLGARCVPALEQPGDLLCPIAFRPAWARRGLAPSRQRLAEHEHRRRAGTFVFVVDPARAIPGGGHRRTSLPDQLYRLFVHAENRTIAIQGPSVGLKHLFHMRRKFGVSVRRDHPVGDLPLAHPVFFSVRRSVSRLTDSTIPNSTT